MNSASFYLLTDVHLVSKDIWVEGRPINSREKGDQIALKATPEILDSFIDKIIADTEVDTVLFTGDNVNGGDMASHRDFMKRLERLRDAGKKVYVTYATHDYVNKGEDECFQHDACRYTETGTEPVEFMPRSGLYDFYYPFAQQNALSVDEESGSYSVMLGDKVRLIMIIDNGNGRSHCGLFEEGIRWLTAQLDEANAAGKYAVLTVHHPVISPFEVYRHMVEYELYGGYRELSELMCRKNARVVFTGHTHLQNIREYKSENGGSFYDVSTIALANAAGKMRRVTIDTEKGECSVTSVGIDELKGVDTGGRSAFDYLYRINMPGIVEKLIPLGLEDYDAFLTLADGVLPVDILRKHRALVRFALKRLSKMKLSRLTGLAGVRSKLTKAQKSEAKATPVTSVVYEILGHIFPGNAPYTPDTAAYVILMGIAGRADRLVRRFNISKIKSLIPEGSSLPEMAKDFLCNNRTGDDDSIVINLKRG